MASLLNLFRNIVNARELTGLVVALRRHWLLRLSLRFVRGVINAGTVPVQTEQSANSRRYFSCLCRDHTATAG